MSRPLSVADVLDRAADLTAAGWTQKVYEIANKNGRCFCARGAIREAARGTFLKAEAECILAHDVLGFDDGYVAMNIVNWNDADDRAQAEVVAKLREAAALARARSAEFGNIGADGVQS